MMDSEPSRRYRFGVFEADSATGELRRKGLRIKLHAQPFQVLFMLLERPGAILTREEICQELWPDGTVVDFEHGVNSVINRLRDALGDKASNPQFVETLARRGYRFLAPVERMESGEAGKTLTMSPGAPEALEAIEQPRFLDGVLATRADLPETSHGIVQTCFILLQLMYLSFYVGALATLAEISELLASLSLATTIFVAVVLTAVLLIPVRIFLLCAVLFRAPGRREKLLKMWPYLAVADGLWALAPFLLLHHITFGLALACVAPLIYAPFAQRSLTLMSADEIQA